MRAELGVRTLWNQDVRKALKENKISTKITRSYGPVRRHSSTEMAAASPAAEFSCFASSLLCCPLERWSTLEHKQNLKEAIKRAEEKVTYLNAAQSLDSTEG